jgi:hypothetical protein
MHLDSDRLQKRVSRYLLLNDPVLRQILRHLAADEARHCSFFSQVGLDTLRRMATTTATHSSTSHAW